MAKDKAQQDLAPVEPSTELALPANLQGSSLVIEGESGVPQLGRLALYQGTAQEQQTYGEGVFRRGDFIDVMERRKVASTKIVPVHAMILYQNWPKDSKVPLYTYSHDQRHQIPRDDLEWHGDQPPAASKVYAVVVLVEGEKWPYLFNFKRTAIKAFESIKAFEARRATMGTGFGCYELYSEDEKSRAGQTYRRLCVKPPVSVPASLHELLSKVVKGMADMKAKAAAMAQDDDQGSAPPYDDNDIPV